MVLTRPAELQTKQELTRGVRADIERHARVGGGINRNMAMILLAHIDRLHDLLDYVISEGEDWGTEEWSAFAIAALPLIDGWPVRTARRAV